MKRGTRRAVLGAAGLGAGLAGGAAALAACSAPGGPSAGEGTAPAKSTAPVSVRLIERLDQESQALDARLPVFRTQFPDITVEREAVPGAELIPKLQTMAAADTMPDNAHTFLGSQFYHNFSAGLLTIEGRAVTRRNVTSRGSSGAAGRSGRLRALLALWDGLLVWGIAGGPR